MCQVGFRVLTDTEAGRRNERGAGLHKQALVEGKPDMKDRMIRFLATLGAVAAMAIAGGASFKGF